MAPLLFSEVLYLETQTYRETGGTAGTDVISAFLATGQIFFVRQVVNQQR